MNNFERLLFVRIDWNPLLVTRIYQQKSGTNPFENVPPFVEVGALFSFNLQPYSPSGEYGLWISYIASKVVVSFIFRGNPS